MQLKVITLSIITIRIKSLRITIKRRQYNEKLIWSLCRLYPLWTKQKISIIKQFAWNKSSFLLKIILQNAQTLQLFTKTIK
jgi:hypothetical protein